MKPSREPDDSIYDGALGSNSPLRRKLVSGELTSDEFSQLFRVWDGLDPTLPSLGVSIVLRYSHALLIGQLAEWTQRQVQNMPRSVNLDLRERFQRLLDEKHAFYAAKEAMRWNVEVQALIIRAMLMFYGLRNCANWTKYVEEYVYGGPNDHASIILSHLREGGVDDIRLFMGADKRFGNEGLLATAQPLLTACASVCATRAPELFLFWGHKLGLNPEHLNINYLLIKNVGGYLLSEPQREQLLRAPYMPLETRRAFARAWKMERPNE